MKHHFVLDTSVYLTYASHIKIYRLENAIKLFGLVVFSSKFLLDELYKNIPKVLVSDELTPQEILNKIIRFTTLVPIIPRFSSSPDPKDNFLFDLALQTYSEVIVTKEKVLLNFIESPIAIHDIKWFKEKFPVEL